MISAAHPQWRLFQIQIQKALRHWRIVLSTKFFISHFFRELAFIFLCFKYLVRSCNHVTKGRIPCWTSSEPMYKASKTGCLNFSNIWNRRVFPCQLKSLSKSPAFCSNLVNEASPAFEIYAFVKVMRPRESDTISSYKWVRPDLFSKKCVFCPGLVTTGPQEVEIWLCDNDIASIW